MTETPGQAFRRVRKQRRDRIKLLCAKLRTSSSMINYAERDMRRIPLRWLRFLPAEYVRAIYPIMRAELDELLPQTKKPRPGGLTGASGCSRTHGVVTQANDANGTSLKSTHVMKTVPDPSPSGYGAPWGCGVYGESRAFRRHEITGHKPRYD